MDEQRNPCPTNDSDVSEQGRDLDAAPLPGAPPITERERMLDSIRGWARVKTPADLLGLIQVEFAQAQESYGG